MSPDEGDHGDVLFVLGLAGKLAELKWYQNVRSLLTPSICPLANIIIRMATCTRTVLQLHCLITVFLSYNCTLYSVHSVLSRGVKLSPARPKQRVWRAFVYTTRSGYHERIDRKHKRMSV